MTSTDGRQAGYAGYIGRVGALAVALGIGGAVVLGPGAAWADETSSTDTSAPSTATGASEEAGSGGSEPERPGSASTIPPSPGSSSETPTRDEPGDPHDDTELPASPSSVEITDESGVIIRSSGGAHTADSGTADDVDGTDLEDDPPETEQKTDPPAPVDPPGKKSGTRSVVPERALVTPGPPAATARAARTVQADPEEDERPLRASAIPAAVHRTVAANIRPVAATSTAAEASSASDVVDLVDEKRAPLRAPGPLRVLTDMVWAAVGWVRRQVTELITRLTPAAARVGTTQLEPLALAALDGPTITTVSFEASPRIGEDQGVVLVPIVRSGDLNRVTTIEYGITADTATEGLDYVGTGGFVTMDVGVQRVYVPVPIVDDDLAEPTETFVVSIINVDGGTLLFPRTARIEILDDENPVVDPTVPPLTSDYIVTEEVVITGTVQPLSFEFSQQSPNLIYVAEKGGVIKVFDIETGAQVSTFVDISAKVNNIQDRGLMDIALHPDFGKEVQPGEPEHNYLYAFYVVDPPDTADHPVGTNAGPDGGGNRFSYLVRFTADAATNYTTAVPGSEVILLGGAGVTLQDISGGGAIDSTSDIDLPESGVDPETGEYVQDYLKLDSRSHAGGSLAFGPDGALYVSVGDGTSFDVMDPRTVSVQNLDSLSGKILRIDPITGLGLPDNPFVEAGDDLSTNRAKVYQLGLRNPFSIGFATDGRLFITNTGWFSWEEIESGYAGANFGWPYFEGGDNDVLLPAPGYQDLPSAAAFYAAVGGGAITVTPAYRAFSHDESAPGYQLGAIVGVPTVAYTGDRYPEEFQNKLFFTDINDGEVYIVDVNDRSKVTFLYQSATAPVAFSQGPDGYMYVANIYGDNITRLKIERKPVEPTVAFVPRGSAGVVDGEFSLTPGQ
ncbi:PQQ-dependent sugar dehydrogenase, partial [Mycolicibacterium phlei]